MKVKSNKAFLATGKAWESHAILFTHLECHRISTKQPGKKHNRHAQVCLGIRTVQQSCFNPSKGRKFTFFAADRVAVTSSNEYWYILDSISFEKKELAYMMQSHGLSNMCYLLQSNSWCNRNKRTALECHGTCQKWINHWCAGVHKQNYPTLSNSSDSWTCPSCRLKEYCELKHFKAIVSVHWRNSEPNVCIQPTKTQVYAYHHTQMISLLKRLVLTRMGSVN